MGKNMDGAHCGSGAFRDDAERIGGDASYSGNGPGQQKSSGRLRNFIDFR